MASSEVTATPSRSAPVREPIYCDCCGTAILAEQVDDTIVIKAKRNGKFHVAVVTLAHRDRKEATPESLSGVQLQVDSTSPAPRNPGRHSPNN